MAQTITLNGLTFIIPDTGETDWGSNLTAFFVAIPQSVLQKTGGNFLLTADVNFGPNFGLVTAYMKSVGVDPATTGLVRLTKDEFIAWRNNSNDGDLILGIDANDNLVFNGNGFQPAGDYISELIGDVTATGPGSSAAIVVQVGGKTASDIADSVDLTGTATAASSPDSLVQRDSSGSFSANVVTADEFIGDVTGDVSGTASNVRGVVEKANGGTGIDNSAVNFPSVGTVVTEDAAQSFSSKTVSDALSFAEISTPANPSSGFGKLYFKNDGLYSKNSAGVEAKYLTTASNALNTRLSTVNYNITIGDDVIFASSGAITLTLPAAAASTGKLYRIQKIDASLSNIITIACSGSDTINGASSTSLNTQWEEVEIVSDGSSWSVLSRSIRSVWNTGTFILGAVTTPPTMGGTVTQSLRWRRDGDSADLKYVTDHTGGTYTVGSGFYLWPLPSGMSIDTTKITTYTAAGNSLATTTYLGSGYLDFKLLAVAKASLGVFAYNANNLMLVAPQGASGADSGIDFKIVSSAWNQLIANGNTYNFEVSGLPINGWKG